MARSAIGIDARKPVIERVVPLDADVAQPAMKIEAPSAVSANCIDFIRPRRMSSMLDICLATTYVKHA
jgi:hypothetical protein